MNRFKSLRHYFGLMGIAFLAGCVTQPAIDAAKVGKPKSIAIVDIPKMRNQALIGVIVPSGLGFSFTQRADYFFEYADAAQGDSPKMSDYAQQANDTVIRQVAVSSQPVSIGNAAAMGAAGGMVGGLMQAQAEKTQKRAMGFHDEIRKHFPDYDLRTDFMEALRHAFTSRGVTTTLIDSDKLNEPLRLRWTATGANGKPYPEAGGLDKPPVDADLLLQVCPIAFYSAPGPLNAYRRKVSVSMALFNARTKAFIGMQTVRFSPSDSKFEYSTYDGLLSDMDNAAPALRKALLSLVPQIVNVATGMSPTVATR